MIGRGIGPYDVVAKLGEGGMGEVYRARDTRLGRDVAIKVLPASFAADAERLVRFKREAQVLASLNHPNIAHVYGLETTAEGTTALVMELVDGPTLADRIARGALPLDEALPIARQIAEALEAAHEQGIIHRDLKPANVKVRADGTVKVLDFGLAKALDPVQGSGPFNSAQGSGLKAHGDLTNSPTITSPAMTQAGMILGTAAYMSPEQARGKPVDKRADIWGFGCVMYEMLTGRRAFQGEDVTETLAAVVKEQPDLTRVSHEWRRLIVRCLEKDPKRRLRDIGEARLALERDPDAYLAELSSPAHRSLAFWRPLALGAITLAAVCIAAAFFVAARVEHPPQPSVSRFQVPLAANSQLTIGLAANSVMSPGRFAPRSHGAS
jgi:serine/threonine-protein kinase